MRDINRAIIDLSASDQLDSIKRKWLIDYVEKISLRAFLKNNTGYLLAVILCIALLSYYVNEKINQKKRERTFLTDPVTGGGNFNRFVSECETLFAENSKPFHYTIVAFNIRNFKMFNENFGYEAGDALLCAIANIAQPVFSPRSFARISADNFVMLIDYAAEKIINSRMGEFADKLNESQAPNKIFLYFGIYVVDDPTLGINPVYDRAQIARRSIENSSERHFAFYDHEIHDRLTHQKDIEDRMASALKNQEFAVYLQPKYHLQTGTFKGSEALARWRDDAGNILPPSEFIDIFEKNGFIRQLDMYVFEVVCKAIHDNADNAHFKSALPISVNISRKHFISMEFIDKLVEISDRYGVPRQRLELEITETAFIEFINDNFLVDTLMKAKEKGFGISLDDFGSGYTSLAMVAEFPLDTIKIDRVFLLSPRKHKILAKVIDIAKFLNMHVVCEGIDCQEQAEMITQFGCDTAQGFYFARPLPIESYNDWAATAGSPPSR